MPKEWRKEKCIFCSLCTVLCPHKAFQTNEDTIEYLHSRCKDCESCMASIGCPRRAIGK